MHVHCSFKRKLKFLSTTPSSARPLNLTPPKADGGVDSGSAMKPSSSNSSSAPTSVESSVLLGGDNIHFEGVIQVGKSSSSFRVNKWGYRHGLSVFEVATLCTGDPYVAGWYLSGYFLGGYVEDGRGTNSMSKGVIAANKLWSLGIPLGILIRAAKFGHLPKFDFVLCEIGKQTNTAVLLLGCRVLLF